jgi:type IV secretory pathway TrbD component
MMSVDHIITIINATASAVLCFVLAWAVLSHRVKDGVVIKTGLICCALGYGIKAIALTDVGLCEAAVTLERARLMTHLGMAIVAVGYWRHLRCGRTICDIVDLQS